MKEEVHASYTATLELAQRVIRYIEEQDLASWKDRRGLPLCGLEILIGKEANKPEGKNSRNSRKRKLGSLILRD